MTGLYDRHRDAIDRLRGWAAATSVELDAVVKSMAEFTSSEPRAVRADLPPVLPPPRLPNRADATAQPRVLRKALDVGARSDVGHVAAHRDQRNLRHRPLAPCATDSSATHRARPRPRTSVRILATCRNLGLAAAFYGLYQLYGTGYWQHQAQSDLHREFLRERTALASNVSNQPAELKPRPAAVSNDALPVGPGIAELPEGPDVEPHSAESATVEDPPTVDVASSDAVGAPLGVTRSGGIARLVIPAAGVDEVILKGISGSQLADGPGWYPTSSAPGMTGNVAIAGHRTTHGAPFGDLDDLKPGDRMVLSTFEMDITYAVASVTIVDPRRTEVVANTSDNRITLTTCHPKFSDRQRLIVVGTLVGASAAAV
jgi:LPXTG-site transpeptidase (sortase) family protein